MSQADELSKLEQACEGVVAKVGDSLRTILEGDEEKIKQQKTVNDSMFPSTQEWKCMVSNKDRTCRSVPENICVEQGQI